MEDLRKLTKTQLTGILSHETAMLGCLLRIADASEVVASNYLRLIADRDFYKSSLENERTKSKRLRRQIAALKGQITKLNKSASSK